MWHTFFFFFSLAPYLTGQTALTYMHVLITGSTRGIGRAIAEGVARRLSDGGMLFLGCRELSAGEALAEELRPMSRARMVPLRLDVTCASTLAAAVAFVERTSGRLDALINNAGILLERRGCRLADIVEPTLLVNFDGLVDITRAFLRIMGGPDSQIINLSSGAGLRAARALSAIDRAALDGASDVASLRSTLAKLCVRAAAHPHGAGETPIYALSKAGVNSYTRLLARRVRVRVNACSPGFCRTEIAGTAADYSTREPKTPALGATVAVRLLFGEIGGGAATGTFFKESSKPGTPVAEAQSSVEPWED